MKLSNQNWKEIIIDWESSGLSQSEYCRNHKFSNSTFSKYKNLYSNFSAGKSPLLDTQNNFVELSARSDAKIEIELRTGVKIRVPLSIPSNHFKELIECLA